MEERYKHTSPDHINTLKPPYSQELLRSISSPACGSTDTDPIGPDIGSTIPQPGQDTTTIPHPAQQSDSTQQLIAGINTPEIPSSFSFNDQRKNAVANIFPVSYKRIIYMYILHVQVYYTVIREYFVI